MEVTMVCKLFSKRYEDVCATVLNSLKLLFVLKSSNYLHDQALLTWLHSTCSVRFTLFHFIPLPVRWVLHILPVANNFIFFLVCLNCNVPCVSFPRHL